MMKSQKCALIMVALQGCASPPISSSGFAGSAQTDGAGRSDDASTDTRLLPAATDRDLKALMLECEGVGSTARAAQEFITINGLAP